MFLKSLLEITMLICFGAAWPISIYKSWNSRSSRGKSLLFLAVIIVGYLAGIGKCLLAGATHWSVVALYVVNVAMVSIDMLLYFRNETLERKGTGARQTTAASGGMPGQGVPQAPPGRCQHYI